MSPALESLRPDRPTAVDGFRSASLHNDPLIYPGERPDSSYITDGSYVSSLRYDRSDDGKLQFTVSENGHDMPVNEYLYSRGATPLEDRIPVLSYGANLNPASLKAKFTKVDRADAQVVPTAYAMLKGSDVVWSGGPGINGNFIAILHSSPDTEQTRVRVGVSFLTREQLLVLHATELNYQLAETPVELAGGYMPVYYYEGQDTVYLKDGKPLAIESIVAEGRELQTKNNREMVAMMLGNSGIREQIHNREPLFSAGTTDPDAYVDFVRSLRKSPEESQPKLAFKKKVQELLNTEGLTALTAKDTDTTASWTNPSSLRTFGDIEQGRCREPIFVLPTTELDASVMPEEARRKVLKALGTHFHRHFADNT